jgi:hypothetical protein
MGIKLEKPLRFVCDDNCDDCVIRFKCYTQRGVVSLDWDDFRKIQELSEIK